MSTRQLQDTVQAAEQQRELSRQARQESKRLAAQAAELDKQIPAAFVVRSSELGTNWSARHHRRQLITLIAEGTPEEAQAAAERFIEPRKDES